MEGPTQEVSKYFDPSATKNVLNAVERDQNGRFHLKVLKKIKFNHDTYHFILQYPDPELTSGLWPSAAFFFHAMIDGQPVKRKYTPISAVNDKG